MRHPLPLTDLFAGFYMTSAILAALYKRKETGAGQYVEISLMGAALGALTNFGQYYLTGGEEPPRMGNNHPVAVPVGLFHASDGMFYMASATDRQFTKMCVEVLGRSDLAEDPRFRGYDDRVRHKEELFAVLQELFGKDTLAGWLAKTRAAGVPAGAVRRLSEALESPEVAESGMLTTVEHPTAGKVRLVGSPFRFSGTPVVPPSAPPLLGQHTEEVLRDLLGLDEKAIAELRAAEAIP
jgi:crotonobetainyl-CoA:carnitine CoA-transferase CaiB-like acyl-CoA transferase